MPSLQIRELPDDLYNSLSLRAEREHRSLAQQALVDLRRALSADKTSRRKRVLAEIRADLAGGVFDAPAHDPEGLIRADRER